MFIGVNFFSSCFFLKLLIGDVWVQVSIVCSTAYYVFTLEDLFTSQCLSTLPAFIPSSQFLSLFLTTVYMYVVYISSVCACSAACTSMYVDFVLCCT